MSDSNNNARSRWNDYWVDAAIPDLSEVQEKDPYYGLIKRVLNIPTNENKLILEVGCGSGIRTIALQHEYQLSPQRTVLVDYSEKALQLARQNAARCSEVPLILDADAFSLPFRDDCFDVVYSEGLAEHYDGKARQEIFLEMCRVCKKGGRVLVIVPNAGNVFYRIEKRILEKRDEWAFGFEKPFGQYELTLRMENAGLDIREKTGVIILRQIVHLARTFASGKKLGKQAVVAMDRSHRKSVRLIVKLERLLEKKLWFMARDFAFIGVKRGNA